MVSTNRFAQADAGWFDWFQLLEAESKAQKRPISSEANKLVAKKNMWWLHQNLEFLKIFGLSFWPACCKCRFEEYRLSEFFSLGTAASHAMGCFQWLMGRSSTEMIKPSQPHEGPTEMAVCKAARFSFQAQRYTANKRQNLLGKPVIKLWDLWLVDSKHKDFQILHLQISSNINFKL